MRLQSRRYRQRFYNWDSITSMTKHKFNEYGITKTKDDLDTFYEDWFIMLSTEDLKIIARFKGGMCLVVVIALS